MRFIFKRRKLLLVLVIGLLIAYLVPQLYGITPEQLLDHRPEHPVMAALVIVLLYAAKSFLFVIPSPALYIAAGIVFPLCWRCS